jgi:hypothetical protein
MRSWSREVVPKCRAIRPSYTAAENPRLNRRRRDAFAATAPAVGSHSWDISASGRLALSASSTHSGSSSL